MNAVKPSIKPLQWVSEASESVACETSNPLKGLSYTLVSTEGGALPVATFGVRFKKALRLSESPIATEDARRLCQEHYEKVSLAS